MKKRFRILLLAPEFKKDKSVQNRIPAALAAIHNFILHHDPNETKLSGSDYSFQYSNPGDSNAAREYEPEPSGDIPPPTLFTARSAAATRREIDARRDDIAQAMWDSYQEILERRLQQQATEQQIDGFLHFIEFRSATRLLGNNDDDDGNELHNEDTDDGQNDGEE